MLYIEHLRLSLLVLLQENLKCKRPASSEQSSTGVQFKQAQVKGAQPQALQLCPLFRQNLQKMASAILRCLLLLAAFGHVSFFASAQNGFFCFFNAAACQSSASPPPPFAAPNPPMPLSKVAQVSLAKRATRAKHILVFLVNIWHQLELKDYTSGPGWSSHRSWLAAVCSDMVNAALSHISGQQYQSSEASASKLCRSRCRRAAVEHFKNDT